MKILVAGGTGAIGRPLILELLAKGHSLVALTRSPEKAQALVGQDIEPAIADVFDSDAVKAVLSRAQPEVVIEQLTALPRTYTRESMSAAAAFNTRLRLEGGANDPARVSYRQILELLFQIHDQTTRNRQGNGRWYQLPICDLLH
jgi:uncharacterized protein YbjT (DUF2867 family)